MFMGGHNIQHWHQDNDANNKTHHDAVQKKIKAPRGFDDLFVMHYWFLFLSTIS